MSEKLRGVIAAIATAVDEKGEPDCTRSAALARFLLANGCDALNVLGESSRAPRGSPHFRGTRNRTVRVSAVCGETVQKHSLPMSRLTPITSASAIPTTSR